MSTFLERAIEYAARRWCWTDETHIAELYEDHPPIEEEAVEDWVDDFAEGYGFDDPRDYGLVGRREADRIDGYDRDDLGESPDF